jgi:hypothetical protein
VLQAYNGPNQAYNKTLQSAFDALQANNGSNQPNNEPLQPAFDAL